MSEHAGPGTESQADPEIVVAIERVRDRFGLRGLRQAAALIEEEIARGEAETRAALEAE